MSQAEEQREDIAEIVLSEEESPKRPCHKYNPSTEVIKFANLKEQQQSTIKLTVAKSDS